MEAYVTKCREPVGILHKSKGCKLSLVVWKSLMYLLGTLGNSCNGLMQTHYATCRKPLGILDNIMRGSHISVGRTVWFGPGHDANTRQDVQVKENHVTIIYNYLRSKKLLFFTIGDYSSKIWKELSKMTAYALQKIYQIYSTLSRTKCH